MQLVRSAAVALALGLVAAACGEAGEAQVKASSSATPTAQEIIEPTATPQPTPVAESDDSTAEASETPPEPAEPTVAPPTPTAIPPTPTAVPVDDAGQGEAPTTIGLTLDEYRALWSETALNPPSQVIGDIGVLIDLNNLTTLPGEGGSVYTNGGLLLSFQTDAGTSELTSIGVTAFPLLEHDVSDDELLQIWATVVSVAIATFEPDMTAEDLDAFAVDVSKAPDGLIELNGRSYKINVDSVVFEFKIT